MANCSSRKKLLTKEIAHGLGFDIWCHEDSLTRDGLEPSLAMNILTTILVVADVASRRLGLKYTCAL